MTDIENDINHIAVHEAGHAVIGRALGMECGLVTIEPDSNSAGHSITLDPLHTLERREHIGRFREERSVLVGYIVSLMAGAESEGILLGHCQGGDGEDRRWLDFALDSLQRPGTETQAGLTKFEQRLRRSCRRLVRHHKNNIQTVADMLLERKTIDGAVLDEMIKPYRPNWLEPPWWAQTG